MTRAEKIKQECERIWNEGETAMSRFKKAKWQWQHGHLVLYVGGRYLSTHDIDCETDE